MLLGDTVVDSVPVEPHRCKQLGYLEAMQRCLRIKHVQKLKQSNQEPVFYLELQSKMNSMKSEE